MRDHIVGRVVIGNVGAQFSPVLFGNFQAVLAKHRDNIVFKIDQAILQHMLHNGLSNFELAEFIKVDLVDRAARRYEANVHAVTFPVGSSSICGHNLRESMNKGKTMTAEQSKILSIVLIVLGAALLIWGFQLSGSAANEVAQAVTGSSSDAVVYRYIGGAISLAAGLFMMFKK